MRREAGEKKAEVVTMCSLYEGRSEICQAEKPTSSISQAQEAVSLSIPSSAFMKYAKPGFFFQSSLHFTQSKALSQHAFPTTFLGLGYLLPKFQIS